MASAFVSRRPKVLHAVGGSNIAEVNGSAVDPGKKSPHVVVIGPNETAITIQRALINAGASATKFATEHDISYDALRHNAANATHALIIPAGAVNKAQGTLRVIRAANVQRIGIVGNSADAVELMKGDGGEIHLYARQSHRDSCGAGARVYSMTTRPDPIANAKEIAQDLLGKHVC